MKRTKHQRSELQRVRSMKLKKGDWITLRAVDDEMKEEAKPAQVISLDLEKSGTLTVLLQPTEGDEEDHGSLQELPLHRVGRQMGNPSDSKFAPNPGRYPKTARRKTL